MKLALVLHHSLGVRRDTDVLLEKELWGRYLQTVLRPLAEEIRIWATIEVLPSDTEAFQTYPIADDAIIVNGRQSSMPRVMSPVRWSPASVFGRLRDAWLTVHGTDLVWVQMPCWKSVAAAGLAVAMGKPYVVYDGLRFAQQGRHDPRNRLRGLAEQVVWRHARFVLVAGKDLYRLASEVQPFTYETYPVLGLSSSDVMTSAHAFDDDGLATSLLYVGNLSARKRLTDLLAAQELLQCAGRLVRAVIVGPGDSEPLKNEAAQRGLADSVTFVPYVQNGEALFDFYRQADVFVLPSEDEGFPRVLYEAMAMLTPIVTTPVGGIPDVLADEKECLFCSVGDPPSIARCVERLAGDSSLRSGLVRSGKAFVQSVLERDTAQQAAKLVGRHVRLRRPRILFVTNHLAPYRRSLFALLEKSSTAECCIVATDESPDLVVDGPFVLPHARLTGSTAQRLHQLRRVLLEFRPDKVVSTGMNQYTACVAAMQRGGHWRTWVWWGGTSHTEDCSTLPQAVVRRILSQSVRGFVAYGQEAATHLESIGVAPARIRVLGNLTIDVAAFSNEVGATRLCRDEFLAGAGLDPRGLTILSVGELAPRKNHLALLRAVERLRFDEPVRTIQVLIVGKGPLEAELKGFADAMSARVVVGLALPWSEMARAYGAADLVVHPSLSDQWPQAVSEAAAAGLPVAVSRESGLGGFVRHLDTGLVFGATNIEEQVTALRALVFDDLLRTRLARALSLEAMKYGHAHAAEVLLDLQ